MEKIKSDIITQTITLCKEKSGKKMSHEQAHRMIKNISVFFQVLQEWAETEDQEECEDELGCPVRAEGVKE